MESRYNDFNVEVIKNSNFPLIKIMKNSYEQKLKAEKEKQRQEECRLLSIQTKGVNIVKEHILKRKKEFLCHQRERVLLKNVKKKEVEENILNKYKINLHNVETRNKIVNKLINYDKSEKMKINTQKQRMKFIVQKLLTEMEVKEKEREEKEKSPTKEKVKKKIKPDYSNLDDIIIEGEANLDLGEAELEHDDWEDVEAKKHHKKVPEPRRSKKSILTKKSRRKSESSITTKKSKLNADPNAYKMPIVSNKNPRYKFDKPTEAQMMDLIPPCHAMNAYLDELEDFLAEMQTYPIDPQFSSKPHWVHFEDFENGKTYTKKLNVYNYSTDTAICTFERIVSDNEFCNVTLEVEDLGMQKLIPGKYYTLHITFRPKEMQSLNGRLVFLTRRLHDPELKRFEVPIVCEIATIKLTIQPPMVLFKSLPFWKSRDNTNNNKTIEIYNGMIHECTLIIREKSTCAALNMEEATFANEPQGVQRPSVVSMRKSRRSRKSRSFSITGVIFKDNPEHPQYIEHLELYMRNLVEICLEYLDHIFSMSSYCVKLPPKSTTNIKTFCKSLPHVGTFSEMYEFEFVSASNNILLKEVVAIEAELTGKFILPEQQYVDFNTCMYNYIYQTSIKIFNYGTSRVKVGFLFPSKVKKYFSIYPPTFFMKPISHETVYIRFMPRKDLRQCASKYFDKFTGILNFPLKICILAPRDLGVPPTSLTIYSIITESDKLNIRFSDRSSTYFNVDNTPILHLGLVTTHETVKADIEIENLSAVIQEYGFFNLPEAISIDPNYGFGIIHPNEIKTLKILFSPSITDMITVDKLHTYEPVEVNYKITVTTAYKLGEVQDKQLPATKMLQKHALSMHHLPTEQVMTSFYELETDDDLFEYHEYLFEQEELEQMYTQEAEPTDTDILTRVEDEDDTQDVQTAKNLTIIIKATIVDYWTEISHQHIVFPDTPLGSYSTMTLQFTALNNSSAFIDCVCGFIKKSKLPNFECHFEIFGGAQGITVEPVCGNLKKSEHKQIYLIAKPSPDPNTVFTQIQVMKQKVKNSIKEMKNSRNVHDLDLYLAEKEVWKSIKPYNIKAKYVIVVNFVGDVYKSNEIIYLTVNCRVVKPQFITSLKSQIINFGPVPIGARPKQIFKIQNVSRHTIEPKIQLMSPIGPFICSTQHKLQLEKEFILKIPITFSPTSEEVYNEYFEIKSENTTETVMVSGEGVIPTFQITPEFNVARLFSRGTKYEDCVIQFHNKCKAPIKLKVVKVCELQGKITPNPNIVIEEIKQILDSDDHAKKGKEKEKEKEKEKDKEKEKENETEKGKEKKKDKPITGKKPKTETMTQNLTPDEEYSLANNFMKYEGPSPFTILEVNSTKTVDPFGHDFIKIRFESPKVIEEQPDDPDPKHKKKKKPKVTTVYLDKEYKYVAKFNILMGNIVLIKDLVLIGTFQ